MVCYEAGCFGYEPARRMQAMGAEVYVIAPQDWYKQRKREVNEKLDAQGTCRRLISKAAGRWATILGLCPSESTTDQTHRMGSITKHGNPRLRRSMVELAWRRENKAWNGLKPLKPPDVAAGHREPDL